MSKWDIIYVKFYTEMKGPCEEWAVKKEEADRKRKVFSKEEERKGKIRSCI